MAPDDPDLPPRPDGEEPAASPLTAREREALRAAALPRHAVPAEPEPSPEPPPPPGAAPRAAARPHLPAVPGRPAATRTRRSDRPAESRRRGPRRNPLDAVRRHAADLGLLLLAVAVVLLIVAALQR